jgi:hypothetical protein
VKQCKQRKITCLRREEAVDFRNADPIVFTGKLVLCLLMDNLTPARRMFLRHNVMKRRNEKRTKTIHNFRHVGG